MGGYSLMKTAAYFLCVDSKLDQVAPQVMEMIQNTHELTELDWMVDGYPVLEHIDENSNRILFIRTQVVICQDHELYMPILEALKEAVIIGMVNWHGGSNAPDKILAIHTVGDVSSANFLISKPIYATNIARALEEYRQEASLDDFSVTTEATHWSGIVYGGNVEWLNHVNVPLIDIEIGSTSESYNNKEAISVISKAIMAVFNNEKKLPNVLYIGGMHFEDTITNAVLHPTHPVSLTHILPTRWVENELYTEDEGLTNLKKCIASIESGIDAFVIHEKLKKPNKDTIRALADELGIPIINRKALKTPENTILYG